MTPTPTTQPPGAEHDPVLRDAVESARAAAAADGGAAAVGEYAGASAELGALTHFFTAELPGYRGWRWAVTVASAGASEPVTISEVVLLPGEDALIPPSWLPWQDRVQAGDLGVGDLLPPRTDDPRLVPGYLASDDPAVEVLATELGLGRVRVLSRYGRTEAAGRWHSGEFGPRSDMARSVQKHCGTCGFYTQLAGSLSAIFGACANEVSPADGRVVDAEYGCGAHSELEIEPAPSMLATELAYDDTAFDVEPHLSDSPPVPDIAGSDTSDSCAAQPSGVEGPPASESTGDAAAADPVTRASGDDAGDEDPAQAPSITVSTPPDLLEGQGD